MTDEQTLAKIRKRDARRVELVDAFGLRQTTEGEVK